MTRAEALRAATARLAAAGIEGAAGDARRLLRWASGLDAAALAARLDAAQEAAEAARFDAAVALRAERAPLSHAIGERAFWGRMFAVTPDVLDPRPETETLVEWALEGPPPRRVLDLGTGSGCILLTLLAERPEAEGLGIEASAAALAVARGNAARLGVAGRATLRAGDWLDGVDGAFDLVVANPPYLDAADMAALSPEVSREPAGALAGGADGLDAYRRIFADLPRALAPGGRALLEIGPTQAADVAALGAAAGLGSLGVRRDLDGRDRVAGFSRHGDGLSGR